MDRLTRMLAGLLRGLAGLLGEHRRDWVHALLAETDDQPAPSARLAWLGGGLWLVAREVLMNRIIQALAFVAGAVGLVWIAWPGASTNSATPVNRMYVVGTLVLLAGLPLLVRRYVGPVRPGWAPLVIRVGGYAVVLALIAATAVQQRIGSQLGGYFPVILPIWAMDVGFLLILAGYVAGLLILTSRRVQFTRRVLPTRAGHRGTDRRGALPAGTLRHRRHGRDSRPLPARRTCRRRGLPGARLLRHWPRWPSPWPCTPWPPDWPTATPDPASSPRPGRPCWPPAAPWPPRPSWWRCSPPSRSRCCPTTSPAATARRRWHLPHLRSEHHRHPGEPAPRVLLRGQRQRCRRRRHRVAGSCRSSASPWAPCAVTSATHRPPPDRGPPRGSVTDPFVQRTSGTDNQGVRRQPRDRVQLPAHGGRWGVGGSQPGVSVSPRLADTPGLRRPGVVGPGRRPGGRRRRRGRG